MKEMPWNALAAQMDGELQTDELSRALYATDASVYRIPPVAVAWPKGEDDVKLLVLFARENRVGLYPRTAGTSLAGQCVGPGIAVDFSRHFGQILEIDADQRTVRLQPGVVRDELNARLEPYGLFFGPNTSTANRCMLGGMVGNNSSGTTSIRYGTTRDKVISIRAVLSDGKGVDFGPVDPVVADHIAEGDDREAAIYRTIKERLSDPDARREVRDGFPKPSIHRRNTGYALDALIDSEWLDTEQGSGPVNLAKLLAGSEGTLALSLEMTLALDPLPPEHTAMIASHYADIESCMADVGPAMAHGLYTCEMMDKIILDCTKSNRAQAENRFFVEGDPAAMLLLELRDETETGLMERVDGLRKALEGTGNSFARPVLTGSAIGKALELRKAGLGLLGNMVGDAKAVACIEDTAVALEDLPEFIARFGALMDGHGQQAVYYAHAGAGELHLRPILDLKRSEEVSLFREITTDVAGLVKEFRGSMSGEHGDGIVRGEFVPMMIGPRNMETVRAVKQAFDPDGLFNPGKIVDPLPMDRNLRYETDRVEPEIATLLDFSSDQGILRAAEKCNGSGDCRKSADAPGGMCPSYQATRDEKDTTRGRANALREFLTHGNPNEPFDHEGLKTAMDLCIGCKACARECPSNVDMAALKAEFSYQYQEANGYGFRAKAFAWNTRLNALASRIPGLANRVLGSTWTAPWVKKVLGVAAQRTLPKVGRFDFIAHARDRASASPNGQVHLVIDEFTRYLDIELGRDAIDLLSGLGYRCEVHYFDSGRSPISKGFLREARELAHRNMNRLLPLLEEGSAIVGLEPSAHLTFRDEYTRFGLDSEFVALLGKRALLIEEFLAGEAAEGRISAASFDKKHRSIRYHAHCHQKALSNPKVTADILGLPVGHEVRMIVSGCCGMAGSFGYEEEHYPTSMAIGELRLFPAIRKMNPDLWLAANGTSCRHQIQDGVGRRALHPVSILRRALI